MFSCSCKSVQLSCEHDAMAVFDELDLPDLEK